LTKRALCGIYHIAAEQVNDFFSAARRARFPELLGKMVL
jgi:hypothetical protein